MWSPSVSCAWRYPVSAVRSAFGAGPVGGVDSDADGDGVTVAPPVRTESGVKSGCPVVPPMSVAPKVHASTSPSTGTSDRAPNGL